MMKKLLKLRKRLYKSKKGGFTLIELIVVIAILGLLMTLAVPAYNGLQDNAKKKVAEANAREVYTAVMATKAFKGSSFTADDVAKMLDTTAEGNGVAFSGGVATWTIEKSGRVTITWTDNEDAEIKGVYVNN